MELLFKLFSFLSESLWNIYNQNKQQENKKLLWKLLNILWDYHSFLRLLTHLPLSLTISVHLSFCQYTWLACYFLGDWTESNISKNILPPPPRQYKKLRLYQKSRGVKIYPISYGKSIPTILREGGSTVGSDVTLHQNGSVFIRCRTMAVGAALSLW